MDIRAALPVINDVNCIFFLFNIMFSANPHGLSKTQDWLWWIVTVAIITVVAALAINWFASHVISWLLKKRGIDSG
jgi:hypothetical protein